MGVELRLVLFLNRRPHAIKRARRLRKEMNLTERRLWRQLRMKQVGFRFRRQFPAGVYVLDFYCPKARVCIEVDGDFHDRRREADSARDSYLSKLGIATLRFWASEIDENMVGVLDEVVRACEGRKQ